MKIGIALSGGGIRGIAHAGVLKALEDNNINVDIIGGTSAGGLVASLYAMGYKPYYIYILFKQYAKDIATISNGPIINGISNYMVSKKLRISGLNKGDSIENIYNELAKQKKIKTIKDIKMPLVIPAIDITEAKEYVFTNYIPKHCKKSNYITNISVGKAVRASSSFPAFFCPCEFEKHIFLDGGTLDNTPVIEIKKQGADKVIAVNFEAEKIDQESDIMDIVMRTIDIMGNKIAEEGIKKSDFILTVPTDKVGLLDIEKLDKCYQYGYDAAIKNMDKIKESLSYTE